MTADELARWLTERGLAEEQRGYGHATGEQIAEALLAAFDVAPLAESDGE